MLYSILLKLKAQKEALVSPTQGYHSYALFLDLVRRRNPELAQRLHDSPVAKPFTLSPLHGNPFGKLRTGFRRSGQGILITKGESYTIRLTIMEDEIFATILDSVLGLKGDDVLVLEEASFKLEEVVTAPGSAPGVGCTSFEAIWDVDRARDGDGDRDRDRDRGIDLHFLSPTTFRSGGKRNVIFPEPGLVFGSLLARWNALSPIKLDESIKAVTEDKVKLAQYNLRTHILHFPNYQEVGFEGSSVFMIDKDVDDGTVQSLNALADFAFYSGVGAKTTMGMGQTRRQR